MNIDDRVFEILKRDADRAEYALSTLRKLSILGGQVMTAETLDEAKSAAHEIIKLSLEASKP